MDASVPSFIEIDGTGCLRNRDRSPAGHGSGSSH